MHRKKRFLPLHALSKRERRETEKFIVIEKINKKKKSLKFKKRSIPERAGLRRFVMLKTSKIFTTESLILAQDER